jgi:hypothetical protein
MCHWNCSSVAWGWICLAMISQSEQNNDIAVGVQKNKQLLLHNSFIHSSPELKISAHNAIRDVCHYWDSLECCSEMS